VEAVVWSDYLCPWCYLGMERPALLARLGLDVTVRPFELHPEIPPGGMELGPERAERWWGRFRAEAAAEGLPFRPPQRVPSTRRALEVAEAVRLDMPGAFEALHRRL
jgi:predicted DsbA family dithiol-disulfide isomerase